MKNAMLVPYTFVLMNWAAVVGLYYFLRSGKDIGKEIWRKHLPYHIHTSHNIAERIGHHGLRQAS